jgi:hypothetical protein
MAKPEARDLDPQNRWLTSQNPRRLEAEFVRDNALFVAGLLNLELGGPSVRPYQPAGYYEALQFPDRDYMAQTDEREYRRGLYMHWQRTFLHPMLANFDAPAREECVAARNVSNTPQQALTLLNDPTFVEAARVFAAEVLSAAAGSDKARIEFAFQRALARPAKSKEISSLAQFLGEQRVYYTAHTNDAAKLLRVGLATNSPRGLTGQKLEISSGKMSSPASSSAGEAELAAWTELCRAILNTHESITKY